MNLRRFFGLPLLAGLVVALPAAAAPISPSDPFVVFEDVAGARIASWRVYSYQTQVLWVVGEVANDSPNVVWSPSVVARFVDPAGAPALLVETPADASYLLPGQQSTFRVTVNNPPPLRLASLEVNGTPVDAGQSLDGARVFERRGAFQEIEEDRIFTRDNCDPDVHDCHYIEKVKVRTDNYLVEGTVVNASTMPLQNVRVSAALYDQAGALVNTGVSGPAMVLAPGQSASYSILVYWAPGTTSFTVRAYSDN
ncbi:MAG: FxLYD domain-containing protein [Dehalococcoidia bacterium]